MLKVDAKEGSKGKEGSKEGEAKEGAAKAGEAKEGEGGDEAEAKREVYDEFAPFEMLQHGSKPLRRFSTFSEVRVTAMEGRETAVTIM